MSSIATSSTRVHKVGNYRLGMTLGVGSFGKVKLAEHEHTHHKVAVKILNRKKIKVQQMEEKLKREIKILKACMHPHIIRLYEVIETPTEVYVVTEYSSGGELFDHIVERGRLSEDEARRFFQQIISGVEYCHKRMVAHRDLKPENLLLDERANVKIADFGLSNCMRDGWFLKTSCGSPNYAAPEVISGKLYAGPEVDVWSCGVIVYALLCGSLPFEDESIPYLFRKIKGGLFILPSYLSDLSRDLINKMLVVNPLKRITIEEIREHPWFTTRLPMYIAHPEPLRSHLENIDQDIVEQASKSTGMPATKIMTALRKGRRNRHTVGYHLLKDANDTLDTTIVEIKPSPKLSPITPEPSQTSEVPASPMILDKMMPVSQDVRIRGATPAPGGSTEGNGLSKENGGHARPPSFVLMPFRDWNVGLILTKASATKVMMDIYRALHRLEWRWKTPQRLNFNIRVLIEKRGLPEPVRLGLQLFKMQNGFQLDMHKLGGDTLAYFVICSDLLTEIEVGNVGGN